MTSLRALLTHLRIRTGAVVTTPQALATLLVFGAATLVFWPTALVPGNPDALEWSILGNRLELAFLSLLWIFLWPQLPTVYCRGRATGRGSSSAWSAAAAPALPVGSRTRAVAETLIVLAIASLVWLCGRIVMAGGFSWALLWSAASGAVVMAPSTLAWALPSRSLNTSMLRPFIAAVLTVVAGGRGLFVPMAIHSWCLVLCALLLLTHHRIDELRLEPAWRRSTATDRSRPPLPPSAQLARDTWLAPLRSWGPWIVLSIVLYVATLTLETLNMGWEWGFFAAFEVFLIIMLQVVIRPFDCAMAMEGLIGKHGAERGDFLRAWSVLPVARHQVLRRVWLHGMVFGAAVWSIPVGMLLVRNWIFFGSIGLKAADGGDLAELILPALAFIPMIAGFLVAACAGRRLETTLSGISLLLLAHGVLLVRILLTTIFGSDSLIADGGTLAFLILLTALAALPPLRLMRHDLSFESMP